MYIFRILTIESTNSNELNPKGIMAYAISSMYMAIGIITAFIIFISSEKTIKLLELYFLYFLYYVFLPYSLTIVEHPNWLLFYQV